MGKKILLRGEVEGVGGCCEAGESVLIDIYSKGVPASNSHIDSHVEFQSVR